MYAFKFGFFLLGSPETMSAPTQNPPSNAPVDATVESRIGKTIDGRYRIVRLIAEGGMGAVYEAEHLTLGHTVALKVILPEYAGNGGVRARFAREAMATAKVRHPNIASALDFGSLDDGAAYLVMERVPGHALTDHLEKEPLPFRRVLTIGLQIADALVAAHSEGIIHRDLKPDNVMLVPQEDGGDLVKVLDFGIARVVNEDGRTNHGAGGALTKVGMIVGTPGYMSPEQSLGERVDFRTDLYSLGVVLWEMSAGKSLFEGELSEILTKQISGEPLPDLRTFARDEVPDEFAELIHSLLAPTAAARPASSTIVRDTLAQLQIRYSRAGDPTPLPFTLARISMTEMASELPSALARSETAKRSLGYVILGAALLGAILGLASGYFIFSPPKPDSPRFIVEESDLPDGLKDALHMILEEEDRQLRRAAAELVASYEDPAQIPSYLLAVAELELNRGKGCKLMTESIMKIAEAGDPRAVPALLRLEATPATGCGPRRNRDCIGCLRDPLQTALTTLNR